MLLIKNLATCAGNFSVQDICLTVPDGACHVLLGGTGNGKTLILETIAGLRPMTRGEIRADGLDITGEPPENRLMSYVPQDLALFPHLSVEKNIYYSHRFKKNQVRTRGEVHDIIQYLGLEGLLKRSVQHLSGGERQRVALARAFATGNRIMLLDEPFSALHYSMKRTLWEMLAAMKQKYNLTMLLVTHDLEEAHFLGDNISVLHKGRILQTGSAREVFSQPNSVEAARITGHYNYFPGRVLHAGGTRCLVACGTLGANIEASMSGVQTGEDVTVAVRTTSVGLMAASGQVRPASAHNVIRCVIQGIHETSHYCQIVLSPLDTPGESAEQIVVDFTGKSWEDLRPGGKVLAFFPEDSVFVFGAGPRLAVADHPATYREARQSGGM